jgi:cation transport ATPase
MNWVLIMNIVASIALLAPIVTIIATRLSLHKTFPFLLFYYIITFVYSIMTGDFIAFNDKVKYYFGITNNILDGPLMLGFLIFMSFSLKQKKILKALWTGLALFTIITIVFTGYNISAIRIVLGPSILFTFIFCIIFFAHYTKIILHKASAGVGKVLISAALIFAYGTYAVIYFLYYVLRSKNIEDAFLIYFLASIFSAVLLSVGVFYEAKRMRRIKEVIQARKEIALIYAEEKNNPSPPKKSQSLDDLFGFDPSEMIPGFRN